MGIDDISTGGNRCVSAVQLWRAAAGGQAAGAVGQWGRLRLMAARTWVGRGAAGMGGMGCAAANATQGRNVLGLRCSCRWNTVPRKRCPARALSCCKPPASNPFA